MTARSVPAGKPDQLVLDFDGPNRVVPAGPVLAVRVREGGEAEAWRESGL